MSARHIEEAVRVARRRWGAGWEVLSEEQRHGAVALAYLAMVAGQDAEAGSHAARIVADASSLLECDLGDAS